MASGTGLSKKETATTSNHSEDPIVQFFASSTELHCYIMFFLLFFYSNSFCP